MTRLTESPLGSQQQTLQQNQLQTPLRQPTTQLQQIQAEQPTLPTSETLPGSQTLPASRPTPETTSGDRLSHDRPGLETKPNTVAAGLPTGHEEPTGTIGANGDNGAHEANPHARLGEVWATVFGHGQDGQATNMLMKKVAVLQATKNEERGTGSTSASHLGAPGSLPAGSLNVNSDGSVSTPGGFTVLNDGGHNWRIREPSGTEHRIWGDPHVDEGNDGHTDWHFNRDASFILPDGTKIFCDTSKVGSYGGADVTMSDQLKVQYGASVASMDVANGGAAALTAAPNGLGHGDGQIFVLAEGSHFVDGRSLGRLYDKGGDFIADVDHSHLGTISDLARITLSGSHEVSRGAAIKADAVRQQAEIQRTQPTLSQMVTNNFTSQRTQARGEATQETGDTGDKVLRPTLHQVGGVTRG